MPVRRARVRRGRRPARRRPQPRRTACWDLGHPRRELDDPPITPAFAALLDRVRARRRPLPQPAQPRRRAPRRGRRAAASRSSSRPTTTGSSARAPTCSPATARCCDGPGDRGRDCATCVGRADPAATQQRLREHPRPLQRAASTVVPRAVRTRCAAPSPAPATPPSAIDVVPQAMPAADAVWERARPRPGARRAVPASPLTVGFFGSAYPHQGRPAARPRRPDRRRRRPRRHPRRRSRGAFARHLARARHARRRRACRRASPTPSCPSCSRASTSRSCRRSSGRPQAADGRRVPRRRASRRSPRAWAAWPRQVARRRRRPALRRARRRRPRRARSSAWPTSRACSSASRPASRRPRRSPTTSTSSRPATRGAAARRARTRRRRRPRAVRWLGDHDAPHEPLDHQPGGRRAARGDAGLRLQRVERTGVTNDPPLPHLADVEVRHQWPPDFAPAPAAGWRSSSPGSSARSRPTGSSRSSATSTRCGCRASSCATCTSTPASTPTASTSCPTASTSTASRPTARACDLDAPGVCACCSSAAPSAARASTSCSRPTARRSPAATTSRSSSRTSAPRGVYARHRPRRRCARYAAAGTLPRVVLLDDDLSDEEMAALYRACDVLVHPYRGEGFAMPVLEAMACGLPVIVTGGGPTDEFCPPDAGLAHPRGAPGAAAMAASTSGLRRRRAVDARARRRPPRRAAGRAAVADAEERAPPRPRRRRGGAGARLGRRRRCLRRADRRPRRARRRGRTPRRRARPSSSTATRPCASWRRPAWRGTDRLGELLAAWAQAAPAGADACLHLLADSRTDGTLDELADRVMAAAAAAGVDLDAVADIDLLVHDRSRPATTTGCCTPPSTPTCRCTTRARATCATRAPPAAPWSSSGTSRPSWPASPRACKRRLRGGRLAVCSMPRPARQTRLKARGPGPITSVRGDMESPSGPTNKRHQGEDACPFASRTTSRRSTRTVSLSARRCRPSKSMEKLSIAATASTVRPTTPPASRSGEDARPDRRPRPGPAQRAGRHLAGPDGGRCPQRGALDAAARP